MGWTPPLRNGIDVPQWKREQPLTGVGASVYEDYDSRLRFGEERVPGARRGPALQGRAEEAAQTAPGSCGLRPAALVPERHGGLRERALLGSQAAGARPYGTAHLPAVRQTLRQNEQERRSRCRGDLRGGGTTEHALRAGEERGAAGGAGVASGAPGLREGS